MNLRTRLERLEAKGVTELNLLIQFMRAGRDANDITGATIKELSYQRNDGESFNDFSKRIEACPHRPPVAFANMIYSEVSNDA